LWKSKNPYAFKLRSAMLAYGGDCFRKREHTLIVWVTWL
jgi:hypothetical protein